MLSVVGAAIAGRNLAGDCENEILTELPSPDGRLIAVVFERDCGATTDFSTQVSVLPKASRLPDQGGNVFVADTNHGAVPPGPGGGPEVEVIWSDRATLMIRHRSEARVFKSERRVKGVTVVYGELSSAGN